LRTGVAFLVPLGLLHALGHPGDAVFVAVAAQTLALPDLRGAYGMRLVILVTMTAVVAGSAMLGVLAGGSIVCSVLVMALAALLGGCWRHLSADYGPPLSVASALLMLLGLGQPGSWPAALHLAGLVAQGGAGAALLQIAFWPFRPQHPLRYVVAETWVAASDLVARLRPDLGGAPSTGQAATTEEQALRAALDRTFVILAAAEGRYTATFLAHLEEMRREVVHFAMRLVAFHTALQPRLHQPDFARELPAVDSVLKALSDAARSVAITLITHRPENLAATEIRLRRCQDLIGVLDDRLAAAPADANVSQAWAAMQQILEMFPRLRERLRQTTDHGTVRSKFPSRLPDLSARSVRSLAAWVNPAPQADPVLVRHALRMALLTMIAVAVYKGFAIPHGYWIAFTIVVVLQPDYGSTRQRAAERIGGTFAGSVLGSGLLWIKMPLFLLDGCAAMMTFWFAYFLKRRYGVAVFFVTLMLVLITETMTKVHLDFTVTRLVSNIVGGGVALVSAVVFWPFWEGAKFTALLAAAIRANRVYLESISNFAGQAEPGVLDLLVPKRRAENANRYAAASLERMAAEPHVAAESAERAAALTTYNQRITRACTAVVVQMQHGLEVAQAGIDAAAHEIGGAMEALAQAVEVDGASAAMANLKARLGETELLWSSLPALTPTDAISSHELIRASLAKCIVEMQAMALALEARPNSPETQPSPGVPDVRN
jgi:uncharacterized membrane protein YccC